MGSKQSFFLAGCRALAKGVGRRKTRVPSQYRRAHNLQSFSEFWSDPATYPPPLERVSLSATLPQELSGSGYARAGPGCWVRDASVRNRSKRNRSSCAL
jgi:hypothetical protein